MLSIERTQSQTDYKEPELKQKLSKTRSCPPRTRRSESSIRSNSSFVPKLPPNFRNGSIAGITSLSSRDVQLSSMESSTSSSVFHGIILVSIMLSSLIAFVCSKIRRPCDHSSYMSDQNCPLSVVLFYSVITIISCLISFVIYFLHLVGQCDLQWIVRKKVTIEMVIISIIVLLLITANTFMVIRTRIWRSDNWFGITSIMCSSFSIIGYTIRIAILCNECKSFAKREAIDANESKIDETALSIMKDKLKNKLNADSNKSWELSDGFRHSTAQNSGTPLRVVSYVKRKKSLDSNPKSVSHNNCNSYDMDVEDDVFIN